MWLIVQLLFHGLRELMTAYPDEIMQLRYPLYNNPGMRREAVWAYLQALEAKAGGGQPSDSKLIWSMDAIIENHPSFSRIEALNHLKGLNTVNAEIITSAIERSRAPNISDDYD